MKKNWSAANMASPLSVTVHLRQTIDLQNEPVELTFNYIKSNVVLLSFYIASNKQNGNSKIFSNMAKCACLFYRVWDEDAQIYSFLYRIKPMCLFFPTGNKIYTLD